MAPDVMARVFEPFFTTKDVGKGTGLGLSMIYGFVKQSGGHIKIYSELGEGTTVKIYFPAMRDYALTAEPVRVARAVRTGDETILLVEDDPRVRQTITTLLQSLGYAVVVAADGPEALRLVDVDVVVGLEPEQERVGEHLPDPEQDDRQPEPLVQGQPTVPGGVDQQRPDERPDDDERQVLEPVDDRVPQRGVICGRDVPDHEHGDPERDRDPGPQQERERAAEGLRAGERREQVARQEEHRERAARREQREDDAEVRDQHVLEHVRGLEVLLRDRVERRDEADDDDRDACDEEREP
jgi:hypothetical protein